MLSTYQTHAFSRKPYYLKHVQKVSCTHDECIRTLPLLSLKSHLPVQSFARKRQAWVSDSRTPGQNQAGRWDVNAMNVQSSNTFCCSGTLLAVCGSLYVEVFNQKVLANNTCAWEELSIRVDK